MAEIWVTSDTHFNHKNILNFMDGDNKKFRGDLFASTQEMNEFMIQNWNAIVKPEDKVYHLGDVFFGSPVEAGLILKRLMGKKRLIVGNHDDLHGQRGKPLYENFQKITLWRIFKEFNMVLSHVPIHKDSFRKVDYNVHGHIHQRKSPSKEYINVCVEQTNYTPVHIEDIIKRFK